MTALLRPRRIATATLAALVAGGLVAAPAQAAPAERYIVSMAPGASFGMSAQSLVGDRIERTLGDAGTFTARLTAAQAARLAANPAVAVVEKDRIVRISATQKSPVWNLDRIDQRGSKLTKTYTPLSSAAVVHAYVIDTGIDVGHPDFEGRATFGANYAGGGNADCDGHGTHVAGTIGGGRYGVAKDVRLVAVKVLGCDGEGELSGVIAGVKWVTAHAQKPAVANMSIGGDASDSLDLAVRKSIASGVTYVAAAGNDNVNACTGSPGRVTGVITVGATDKTDTRAWFSNYGQCVDIFAPGVGIWSAYPDWQIAELDGTSMASPHVAGAAAMLLAAAPTLKPSQVAFRLISASTKSRVRDAGSKSPNRLLFTAKPPAAAKVSTASLATAKVGAPYRRQLVRSASLIGAWKATGLPEGMHVSRAGVLSGTPAEAGTYTVKVSFTDFVPRTANRSLTLRVA